MEQWGRTLSQIRTRFGRLIYVAGLRDPSSGRYIYGPMVDTVGSEVTDRTLASSHYNVFADWIALPLSRQKADLDEYLENSGATPDVDAYRALAPQAAHDVERQIYFTDLETLLALLRFGQSGASRTQEA
jgi:hypothetical protein